MYRFRVVATVFSSREEDSEFLADVQRGIGLGGGILKKFNVVTRGMPP